MTLTKEQMIKFYTNLVRARKADEMLLKGLQEGKVVAVGPGKLDDSGKRIALQVKEGNRILFGKYAGSEIKIDGEEHIFMREDDILGILN